MKLNDLLDGFITFSNSNLKGVVDKTITGLALNSQSVVSGSVFIALAGSKEHGLSYIDQAVAKGAIAVIFDPAGGGKQMAEQLNYLPLIEEAATKGEIPFTRFAMMQDRYLTQQGKEQIYGTQAQGKLIANKQTGKEEFFTYISPIQNPEKVNERRKKAGFTTTVEENAKRMRIEYKVYTLDDIAKIF